MILNELKNHAHLLLVIPGGTGSGGEVLVFYAPRGLKALTGSSVSSSPYIDFNPAATAAKGPNGPNYTVPLVTLDCRPRPQVMIPGIPIFIQQSGH